MTDDAKPPTEEEGGEGPAYSSIDVNSAISINSEISLVEVEQSGPIPTVVPRVVPPPPPAGAPRKTNRSLPAPVPGATTMQMPSVPAPVSTGQTGTHRIPSRKPGGIAPLLATGQPESPSVVDRALAIAADGDRAREVSIKKELARAASLPPRRAAIVAYEHGELNQRRFGDDETALEAFRKGIAYDPALRPNRWALRRLLYQRRDWDELAKLLASAVDHVDGNTIPALLLERAHVLARQGVSGDEPRGILERARALVIGDRHAQESVLLELQRVVAHEGNGDALLDVTTELSHLVTQPHRKVALLLEVARLSGTNASALAACKQAVELAVASGHTGSMLQAAAREMLTAAQIHGTRADIADALEILASSLSMTSDDEVSGLRRAQTGGDASDRARELAAIRRRQAQLIRATTPADAWNLLQEALAFAPDDPVILSDLIELAAELGRYQDLLVLVHSWRNAETETGRAQMLSTWCAEAHESTAKRFQSRALLGALSVSAPGFILLTAAAENVVIRDLPRAALDLATTYLDAAKAAASGIWVGLAATPRPDPLAAAALYVQAAELLAYHVGTPMANVQARDALAQAAQLAPDHPIVTEARIELDDHRADAAQAVSRILSLTTTHPERDVIERATRVAARHELSVAVIELERRLVALVPKDCNAAWRLEATLARAGHHEERGELLATLVANEQDPLRRLTAVLEAARLAERIGPLATASDRYRELCALAPDARFARDAYAELLREQERWAELVARRRADAATLEDMALVRRAFREAAWVLEVRLNDVASAAETYAQWHEQMPDDRTALEGVARCRAVLRDYAGEAVARAAIAVIDQTPDARWQHARSLEQAGDHDAAIERYRELVVSDDPSVAITNAALALGDLAAQRGDVELAIVANTELARRTSDLDLSASSYELAGWLAMFGLGDHARAAVSFTMAIARQPHRCGALLGAALTHPTEAKRERGDAIATLAEAVEPPDLAGALYVRGAMLALSAGDVEQHTTRIDDAVATAPDDPHVLCVAAETRRVDGLRRRDPFAAVEQLTVRADVLAKRSTLSDNPRAVRAWMLERAECLELAGELQRAARELATWLTEHPGDRRALAGIRRLAVRARDDVREAEASYALAIVTRATESKLRLLRAAVRIYDRPGRANHGGYAKTIYRQIATLDPAATEIPRLLELLRADDSNETTIHVLTDLLTALSSNRPDDPRLSSLLLERARALRASKRPDIARADVDAILAFDPSNLDAHTLRAEIDATQERRRSSQMESTDPSGVTAVEEVEPDLFDTPTVQGDPFGGQTQPGDSSALQEEERRIAGARTTDSQSVPDIAFADSSQLSAPTVAERPMTNRGPSALHSATSGPRVLLVPALPATEAPVITEPVLDIEQMEFPDEPSLAPDHSAAVLLSRDQIQPTHVEAYKDLVFEYERELTLVASDDEKVTLHLDAGRFADALGSSKVAPGHYEAALRLDASATPALQGLRRHALGRGDFVEAGRLLDVERELASPRERPALDRYRVDLQVAIGDLEGMRAVMQDELARATTPGPAVFDALALAASERQHDALPPLFEQLATVEDRGLRTAALTACGVLALRTDKASATRWFVEGAQAGSSVSALRLEVIRALDVATHAAEASTALVDLAQHVEREDPETASAIALRAWLRADTVRPQNKELLTTATQLAARTAARDPLVARIVAETALATKPETASNAFVRWTRCKSERVERAYAAARAAELDPDRLARLWSQVNDQDPGDDYAYARMRSVQLATGASDQVLELDVSDARDTGRDAPLLRAANRALANGDGKRAVEILTSRESRTWPITLALAEAYASVGLWEESATTYEELFSASAPLAPELVHGRRAHAWSQAAKSAPEDDKKRIITVALGAWNAVVDADPCAPVANAAALELAQDLADRDLILGVLTRLRENELDPAAATSLALREARLLLGRDPERATDIIKQAASADDPRGTLLRVICAGQRQDLDAAGAALAEYAAALEVPGRAQPAGDEPSIVRVRAAQLALDGGDAGRARTLLASVASRVPDLVDDLLLVISRREDESAARRPPAGDRKTSFARLVRDADSAVRRGENEVALELYVAALTVRPRDPMAALPALALATQLARPDALLDLARQQAATAEDAGLRENAACALELVARIEQQRGDRAAALETLTAALGQDPARVDLAMRLELAHAARLDHDALRAERERLLSSLGAAVAVDPGFLLDSALIALRAGAEGAQVASLCRQVLAGDPANQHALFHLESYLCTLGPADELASVEAQIAQLESDPHHRAAFLTRSGEVLADLGKYEEAVERFADATHAAPDYTPALDLWRHCALAGELWVEVAEAAKHEARIVREPEQVAAQHHFAAVAYMDKADDVPAAFESLCHALEADPRHVDSLLRLRIVSEQNAVSEPYVSVLTWRLANEDTPAVQVEVQRLLAEHHSAIGNPEQALREYRALLAIDPAEVRAHAAIADLSTDPNDRQKSADAIAARIRLERDVQVLRGLHYRLGEAYADTDPPQAIAAFQRALTYRRDDESSLRWLVELAMRGGDWRTAASSCERLVEVVESPEARAGYMRQTAIIFAHGLGDGRRAEEMLDLALTTAPTDAENVRVAVDVYSTLGDAQALRARLERIAMQMRARCIEEPTDGAAARVLSRSVTTLLQMSAVPSGRRLARAAAELAQLAGAAEEPERVTVAMDASEPPVLDAAEIDLALFEDAGEPALRELLRKLSEPVHKHLGADIARHGVGRKERVAANHPITASVRAVAANLGMKNVDIYISRQPFLMVAEATKPVSLVIGSAIAENDRWVRFAAGGALKLAQLGLAGPARLPLDELIVLAASVLRVFQLPAPGDDEVLAQRSLALRKLISQALQEQARPLALSIGEWNAQTLARDLRLIGIRAGYLASGSLAESVMLLAAIAGTTVHAQLLDPAVRRLVAMALA